MLQPHEGSLRMFIDGRSEKCLMRATPMPRANASLHGNPVAYFCSRPALHLRRCKYPGCHPVVISSQISLVPYIFKPYQTPHHRPQSVPDSLTGRCWHCFAWMRSTALLKRVENLNVEISPWHPLLEANISESDARLLGSDVFPAFDTWLSMQSEGDGVQAVRRRWFSKLRKSFWSSLKSYCHLPNQASEIMEQCVVS